MPAPERIPLGTRLIQAPLTTGLFAICIVIFVLAERDGDTTTPETLLQWGAAWRGSVWLGEWWRLLSACFLHIGIGHLVWNVLAGFGWASPIEQRLGPARFLALYVMSGIVGSAASVLGHSVASAGASGSLFGCMGAQFAFDRADRGSWSAVIEHRVKDLMMIVLWFGIGALGTFDNFAHAGGLLGGLTLGWWFVTPSRQALALVAAPLVLIPLAVAPTFTSNDFNRPDRIFEAQANGRWKEALELIDQQIASSGSTPYLVAARGAALDGSRNDDALGSFLANVAPGDWTIDLRVTQARLLMRRGDPDGGLSLLDQAVATGRDHLDSRIQRAWALLRRDPSRAPADIEVIARLASRDESLPLLRGWVALMDNELDVARTHLGVARPSVARDGLEAAINRALDAGAP